MSIQEKLFRLFSFGLQEKTDPWMLNRIILTNAFSFIGLFFIGFFAVEAIILKDNIMIAILTSAFGLGVINIFYLVKSQKIEFSAYFLTSILGIIFIFLVYMVEPRALVIYGASVFLLFVWFYWD